MQEIDSREFVHWLAFLKVDNWTRAREDLNLAQIASIIANANRSRAGRRYRPKDFMPHQEPPVKRGRPMVVGLIARLESMRNGRQH